jgi:23S rRNA pseudouridine2605 synthase
MQKTPNTPQGRIRHPFRKRQPEQKTTTYSQRPVDKVTPENHQKSGGISEGYKKPKKANGNIHFKDIINGYFDQHNHYPITENPVKQKRILKPEEESPKLHKVLAQAGLGSRLEMENLITQGRISVNGEPAHIGQRIRYSDQVKVNGKLLKLNIAPPPVRLLAYHKATGEVVTHRDPQNRPTIFQKLPKLNYGKWLSVGRLDINTEGLILISNSGELVNKLTHPKFGLQREYAVRILGTLTLEEKQSLLDGIQLEDGKAQFLSIECGGGEGVNTWYRVSIGEGRNREVRRMFDAVGYTVSRLIRIRYGNFCLPRYLKRSTWEELKPTQIQEIAPNTDFILTKNNHKKRNEKTSGHSAKQNPMKKGGLEHKQKSRQPDPMQTNFGYLQENNSVSKLGVEGPFKKSRKQRFSK